MAKQKMVSYKQMLKTLEIPEGTPETIICQACQKPMHWHPINKYAGYWLHKGEDIDYCSTRNPLHPGKPLIAQNLHFYRTIGAVWKGFMTKYGKKKDDSENSGKRT